jgi:hypothetical protein
MIITKPSPPLTELAEPPFAATLNVAELGPVLPPPAPPVLPLPIPPPPPPP